MCKSMCKIKMKKYHVIYPISYVLILISYYSDGYSPHRIRFCSFSGICIMNLMLRPASEHFMAFPQLLCAPWQSPISPSPWPQPALDGKVSSDASARAVACSMSCSHLQCVVAAAVQVPDSGLLSMTAPSMSFCRLAKIISCRTSKRPSVAFCGRMQRNKKATQCSKTWMLCEANRRGGKLR